MTYNSVAAIIVAAGSSTRFGAPGKVFEPLLGQPVLEWSLAAHDACPFVGTIVVVGQPSDEARVREACGRALSRAQWLFAPGGSERQESVANGLAAAGPDAELISIHDAARPGVTPGIIAAVAGKAKRVNVIMPMLYESRQHRRSTRESLDCALALQELQNMGVANVITFDAHDPRVVNAVPLCGFENVLPTYQMLKALLGTVKDLHINKNCMMIVSPDEGAVQRNIYYSSVLSLNMGMFYKRRDYTQVVAGRNPIVAHEYLGESVEGKDVIVVDDILSSGESIIDLAKQLKKRKAKRIFAIVTFAFFTDGIQLFEDAYQQGIIDRVVTTNLSYTKPELQNTKWFIRADLSKYVSYIIATLNHDNRLSALLNPYNRIQKLLDRYRAEQAANGISLV